MTKRMISMLVVIGALVAGLAAVKFHQIQEAIAQASSFQPPPEAVTTVVAKREAWPDTLQAIGSVAAVLLSAVLFGCAPAWQAARLNLNDTLKEGGRALRAGRNRMQRALVVVEFALALTLLAGGGLAVHSLMNLSRTELGFPTERLLTFFLPIPPTRLEGAERIRLFHEQLHGRIEAGLDAVFAARYPHLRARRIGPVLDAGSIGFVQHAYEDTYGIDVDPFVLLRAHRGASRRAAQGLVLAGLNSRTLPRARAVRTGQGEWKIRGRLAKSSLVFAYLLPVRPPGWLLASVRSALRRFPRLRTESWRSRLEHLENRNLDTGRLETPHDRHGAFLRAQRYVLAARAAASEAAAA